MIYIGAKTLFIITMLVSTAIISFFMPQVSISWVTQLLPEVLFTIGGISVLSTSLVYSFWSFSTASLYRYGILYRKPSSKHDLNLFSVGDITFVAGPTPSGQCFDFPPLVNRLFIFISSFLICVTTINNRGLQLIKQLDQAFIEPKAHFCPDYDTESEPEETKAGCDLILKAWELGYVKSLGSCAPDEKEDLTKLICKKRHLDEPWIHYSYRRMNTAIQLFSSSFNSERYSQEKRKLQVQWDSIDKLSESLRISLNSEPRSAHHIWTNLPHPDGWWGKLKAHLGKDGDCLQEWSKMDPTLIIKDKNYGAAQSYRHSFGQILFNGTHRPSAGYCREYHIHWNTEPGICKALSQRPIEALKQAKIEGATLQLVSRHKLLKYIKELKSQLESLLITKRDKETLLIEKIRESKKDFSPKKISPNKNENSRVISFQCLWFEQGEDRNSLLESEVNSYKIPVLISKSTQKIDDIDINTRFHHESIRKLSELLVPNFKPNLWKSYESSMSSTKMSSQSIENSQVFMLSKLEKLKTTDIVLGQEQWINKREDLLEVYPWYIHLYNYVEEFRKKYQDIRSRL